MKKVNVWLLGVTSLLLLSACGKPQIVKPDKVELSSSKEIKKSSEEKVSSLQSSENKSVSEEFDSVKAKAVVKDFLYSYYNYESENRRNEATKVFCSPEVQKKLHLVRVDKDIKMRSSVTSSDIYEGGEGGYMVLVSYELNGNSVTPQVLKISVQEEEGKYLVSAVDFPLMN
ncbi:EF0163 family protein [Lactococcus muris]|uniref:EF0163 family protein n=1 Tax=Lactococcus muris TaxID=2941330 RepID=A0ABV4D8B8_9LACT